MFTQSIMIFESPKIYIDLNFFSVATSRRVWRAINSNRLLMPCLRTYITKTYDECMRKRTNPTPHLRRYPWVVPSKNLHGTPRVRGGIMGTCCFSYFGSSLYSSRNFITNPLVTSKGMSWDLKFLYIYPIRDNTLKQSISLSFRKYLNMFSNPIPDQVPLMSNS